MKVIIYGPNGIRHGGAFDVHAEGCADTKNRRLDASGERGWVVEASTERQVVEDIYGDMIAESGGTWESYADDIRFFPCVNLPSDVPQAT